jgi:membrane protease YdiL (CAAX protease family)
MMQGTRWCVALWLVAAPLAAQDSTRAAQPPKPRTGSELFIPLGSVVAPGLGQYLHGAYSEGVGYAGAALLGYAVRASAESERVAADELPREGRDQLTYEGYHLQFTAGLVSAWDAFHRAVPALQQQKKYEFLATRETLGDLLTAPFEFRFLQRWTTWLDLAYTGLMTGLILSGRSGDGDYEPLRAHDFAFASALALNAAVGEEAFFRAWLLPLLYQNTGDRFWLSNSLQAALFGALHAAQAEEFALVIAGWALYEGWLTRRNEWSVRESIFHHFWYDVAIVLASFLADEREPRIQLTLPTIRF